MRTFLFYVWCIGGLIAYGPAYSKDNAFLNAVSFALTGSDRGVQVVDLKRCVFRVGDYTYYLNNVQVDRIVLQKKIDNFLPLSPRRFVAIQIHGTDKVTDEFVKGSEYIDDELNRMLKQQNPSRYRDHIVTRSDYEFNLYTDEYERLMRAWSFIYANGCTGKRSAF